uniref:Uncharacterized protein n=1 Tax=Arundo donax TaxID=35708 RepID=A0A0A9DK59_ARUDO
MHETSIFSFSSWKERGYTCVQQENDKIGASSSSVNSICTHLYTSGITRQGFCMGTSHSTASSLEEVVVRARRRQLQELLLDVASNL